MDVITGREFLAEIYFPAVRDQRLQWFAQGRQADVAPGSGWMAQQAGDVTRPEVLEQATDDEVLGIGRTWKALETWCFTQKLAVVRELVRRYPLLPPDDPGVPDGGLPGEWDPRLHHEVAAALGISVPAAARLARVAWTLDCRLPGTGRALAGSKLDPGGVRMIVDEASVLEREALFARAEQIILAGLARCKTWADLQRLVQRAVITADPDGARKRREQAEREHARVKFWRESSGTCGLQATGLPADEALAANARIEGRARAYKAARIARPMDILRVMGYLDILNEVTTAQRAAWAQADAAARTAEEDEQAARDAELRKAGKKAREKARRHPATSGTGQHPEAGDRPDGERPDGERPDGERPDGERPDGERPDGERPDGDRPDCGAQAGARNQDGNDPDGPDGNGPGGDGPGGDGPGSGHPGDGGPDGRPDGPHAPDGGAPGDGGPADDDGNEPGGWPGDDGGPWPEAPGGGTSAGRDDGYPGDWPADDGGYGDGGPGDEEGPLPEDPGDCRDWNPPDVPDPPEPPGEPGDVSDPGPCPVCRGAGGGIGLPIMANLTLPAAALDWLAEWSAEHAGDTVRGPAEAGSYRRGGPGPCPACGKPGSASMPALANLAFPLLTLLGVAERPRRGACPWRA